MDFSLVEKQVKPAPDHGIEQREFIGVMIVKSRPINRCRFSDILNRNAIESLVLHKGTQGSLQELTGAPDARIANFTVGNRHVS